MRRVTLLGSLFAVVVSLAAVSAANAGGIYFSVGVDHGYYRPVPVYSAPVYSAPVYVAQPVYVAPAPVYVEQVRPRYVRPVVYRDAYRPPYYDSMVVPARFSRPANVRYEFEADNDGYEYEAKFYSPYTGRKIGEYELEVDYDH